MPANSPAPNAAKTFLASRIDAQGPLCDSGGIEYSDIHNCEDYLRHLGHQLMAAQELAKAGALCTELDCAGEDTDDLEKEIVTRFNNAAALRLTSRHPEKKRVLAEMHITPTDEQGVTMSMDPAHEHLKNPYLRALALLKRIADGVAPTSDSLEALQSAIGQLDAQLAEHSYTAVDIIRGVVSGQKPCSMESLDIRLYHANYLHAKTLAKTSDPAVLEGKRLEGMDDIMKHVELDDMDYHHDTDTLADTVAKEMQSHKPRIKQLRDALVHVAEELTPEALKRQDFSPRRGGAHR